MWTIGAFAGARFRNVFHDHRNRDADRDAAPSPRTLVAYGNHLDSPSLHPGSGLDRARVHERGVASRYYGLQATPSEVDRALEEEPYEDLTGKTGVFLIASEADKPIACAGARFAADTAELTKVYTLPGWRGRGVGRELIAGIEAVARGREIRTIRLDTRSDLVEACALYERLGFERVPAFNDEPYSDRWYAKTTSM